MLGWGREMLKRVAIDAVIRALAAKAPPDNRTFSVPILEGVSKKR